MHRYENKKVKRLKKALIIAFALIFVTLAVYSFRLIGFNTVTWKDVSYKLGLVDDTLHQDSAKFWFLDVGQGDCSIIQIADTVIMIDCGKEESFPDIVNFMRFNLIDEIDYLIVSHPHNDHIGSAWKVIDRYNVKELFYCKSFVPEDSNDSIYLDKMLFSAGLKDTKVTEVNNLYERDLGIINFKFYCPSDNGVSDENDMSTVVMASVFGKKVLYPGDIGFVGESFLVQNNYDIDCDVLKVPHHGSKYSTSNVFLEKTTPDYAVFCVGWNIYGHPTDEVVQKLINSGSKVFRTDYDTVCIGIDPFGNIGSNTV